MDPYDVNTLLRVLGDISEDVRLIREWVEGDDGEEEEADG
jgi:hypothetical protein